MFKFLLNFIPGVGPFLSDGWTLISNFGGFVVKHWIVFLFLVMAGTILYQNEAKVRFLFGFQTIPALEVQITTLQTALNTAVTANKTLTNNISSLNSVVGQWHAISTKLQKQNNALQGALNKQRAANNKKVQSILNGKTPTTCEGSIDFLRTEKGQLSWGN